MILCTHAIVGGAVASFLPSHPASAFLLGFASHFALDAIPHWDYPIRSSSINPNIGSPLTFDHALVCDVVTIGLDGLLGTMASLVLFATPESAWTILLGAAGAMLPDPLQFVHAHFPREPFCTLQRFHRFVHTHKQIKGQLLGVASQLILVASVVALALAAHRGLLFTAFALAHSSS
jgi:hypothetical protein